MTESTKQPSFEGLGINETFLQVLTKHRFVVPTPIQHKAIPVAVAGEDVIGIAQTGTGKTLAFGVPMLQRLYGGEAKGIGLVLLPTRELALQVEETLQKTGGPLGLRTAVLIGGENMRRQVMQLRKRPHVLVATPGRLLDLVEQGYIRLDKTAMLVLDEADRMLDMGFAPQLNRIMHLLPPASDRQTMLFSATMPADIVTIANTHMRTPVRVEVAPEGTAAETVEQEIYIVRKEDKVKLLAEILEQYTGSVLVFSRTKHGATKLCRHLLQMGHQAAEIHANKSLAQRVRALEGFKRGQYRILVATDIAARGIDVKGIELVVNFDLPDNSADYVHRIGRTGRAGLAGRAISLAMPDQRNDIRDIERLIRKPLPVSKHPHLSVELPAIPAAQRGIMGGRRRSYPRRPRFNRR
ncbi:MAG: DEAD/DEAH box helicase [Candidatus Yanofskybacteria bacterium]|nr:DEAD/DEAH box helicase [Candidatus Yanofskybacteria bacterium]